MKSKSRKHVLTAAVITLALSIGIAAPSFADEYREADVQAAITGLASPDYTERKTASFRLTEMGAKAVNAVPALTEVVRSDESMLVRGEASHDLGNIGPAAESAVPVLIAFLQNENGCYDRTYAASALGDIGKHPEIAVPALINALQNDQEPVVRELAARALGGFGAQAGEAVPVLVDAIKTGDKGMREAAACGLEKIPARSSDVPALVALLSDEINSARIAAAKSLAGLGGEAVAAVPQLATLLTDKDSHVKSAAAAALGKIGSGAKPAIPSLKTALKDAEIASDVEEALHLIKSSK